MERANVIIVGGGVVGWAIAAELAPRPAFPRGGRVPASRNSGVIHSGIYYAPGSLKARCCVEGNRLTYEFCAAHGVPHQRTGKFVVATTAEEERELHALLARGRENGVSGLELVTAPELRRHEPHVAGRAALRVPSTGLLVS